jgi:transcriptional regulator with XRE-family HTH domain
MADANGLGEYLRARRELITPDSAGIPRIGIRRVAGLRREEVAMLAGISADYYLRLEQGRDRNPSVQVLESLAGVLQLDDAGAAYLMSLACEVPRRRRRRPRKETVAPGIGNLLDSLALPAFVEGRYYDVLAANRPATALSPRLRTGHNRLRDMFLDPAEQAFYPDWEQSTVALVAGFRESVGTDTDDPRLIELVGELSLASERFRTLWARHDVKSHQGASVTLDHPQLGAMTLNREKLAVGGTSGQFLVLYHPDRGSGDADKLNLLASFQADPHGPAVADKAAAGSGA